MRASDEFYREMKRFQSLIGIAKKIVQVKIVGEDPSDRIGQMTYEGTSAYVRPKSVQMGTKSFALDIILQGRPDEPVERVEIEFGVLQHALKELDRIEGFPEHLPEEFFESLYTIPSGYGNITFVRAVSSVG